MSNEFGKIVARNLRTGRCLHFTISVRDVYWELLDEIVKRNDKYEIVDNFWGYGFVTKANDALEMLDLYA